MNTNNTRNVAVGTVRKSTATICWVWVRRKVFQACDEGRRSLGRYLRMVESETCRPSFANSSRMRGLPQVDGHPEIELALVRLYRTTGDRRLVDLAKFFVDERGDPARPPNRYSADLIDEMPLFDRQVVSGHAVRAGYYFTGATDIAALTGDPRYREVVERLWTNMVSRKLYLHGGIGAVLVGERFGDDYRLPNATAYCETCASVANMLWSFRLFRLTGESKYLDVLERVLYNGFLSGVSLGGDRFSYQNRLMSDGDQRSEWYETSCCPVNVARFLPSLGGYVYATTGDSVYLNLFVASSAQVDCGGQAVRFTQSTRYPWDGRVEVTVAPQAPRRFALRIRIPGWARNEAVPSDLYRFADGAAPAVKLAINGQSVPVILEHGFALLDRDWTAGDCVELNLPMRARRVLAHEAVADDKGRIAIQRGPLVYCVEASDNGGPTHGLALPDTEFLDPEWRPALLGGVVVLHGHKQPEQAAHAKAGPSRALTAIPYCTWANRGPQQMDVWLLRPSGP